MIYYYGMRLRPYSIGCQPKEGLVRIDNDPAKKYWNILGYNRKLTEKEINDYELDYLPKKGWRITYEVVFDIYADSEDEAKEIAEEMLADGDFDSIPVKVEELEDES